MNREERSAYLLAISEKMAERKNQFFELYRTDKKVAPLVRQLSWSHHLIIMGRCKQLEEREFYLRLAIREHWSKRELNGLLSRLCRDQNLILDRILKVL